MALGRAIGQEGGIPMTRELTSSTKSILGLSLCLSVLFLFCLFVAAAKRKSTIEIPEGSDGLVAYGSLISLASMEKTLGHKYQGPINPIHLTGYKRAWECLRPLNDPLTDPVDIERIDAFFLRGNERIPFDGAVELNIHPKRKGRINAILYLISNAEMISLDKREWGYRRVDVTDKIEECQFRGGRVYVYEGLPERRNAFLTKKGTYILMKEFVDLLASACDAIGKNFRDEFDKSIWPCKYEVVPFKNIIWGKTP
jgi:hypothetical protein